MIKGWFASAQDLVAVDVFIKEVMDILKQGHEKGYEETYEAVGSFEHATTELQLKVVRYKNKRQMVDLVKIGAWALRLWLWEMQIEGEAELEDNKRSFDGQK